MCKLVGFTYDLKSEYLKEKFSLEDVVEFDTEQTIEEITSALTWAGYKVEQVGSFRNLLSQLSKGKSWDIVFNIAEGISGRNRESQVPLLLEYYKIPYTGSDALTMGICLDKVVSKKIVSYHNLPTPKFFVVSNIKELSKIKEIDLSFPVMVKPSCEGSSKGLSKNAVVYDKQKLKEVCEEKLVKYKQPVLIEEFIYGKEFTVVVMGNKYSEKFPIKSFPPVQIAVNGKTDLGEEFFTYERIENDETSYICPSAEPENLLSNLEKITSEIYKVLEVRDFGRIDFRVDYDNNIYFLECNPLPHLGKIDVFPLVANAVSMSYEEMISNIVKIALDRYNI